MMDPGELNRYVLLRLWSDTPNVAFGLDQTVDGGVSLWAKVEPVHGLAIKAGMNAEEVPTHLFWIRYSEQRRAESITRDHVFEFKGRRYRVLDAINVDDGRMWVRISTKDLGPIPAP